MVNEAFFIWAARLVRETNETFFPLYMDESRYLVLMGGGGSGKSIFAGRKIIERASSECGHRFLIVRKVARTLRESCFRQLTDQLRELGIKFTANQSDMTIRLANGSELIFSGLDNVEKLKSIYNVTGIWIEEASELLEEDFNQLDIRLRGESSHYKQIILTFNPISALHWLKRRFFDRDDPRARVHRSAYRDNRFLDKSAAETLESFRESDPYYYQVYCLGEWGVTGRTIFNAVDVTGRLSENVLPVRTGTFIDGVLREGDTVKIYREPEPGRPYVIGADTAGEGSDFFVAQVLDNVTGEQAAVLRQQSDEGTFADALYALGMMYNGALIGAEVNFSTYTVMELSRRGYPRQYVRQDLDSYTGRPMERFGFVTNRSTRETIISGLVSALRGHIELVSDRATLEEMLTFVRNEQQRAEAQQGAHDDCVMALAIAHHIRPQQSYSVRLDEPRADWTESMWEDFRGASREERALLLEKWGRP